MASRHRLIESGSPSRRGLDLARAIGFLTLLVGFLTFRSGAAPLDEELRRLDTLENRRDHLLAGADSLGGILATLPPGDRRAGRLLRNAEALGEQSRDIDLEILLARERCRSLAEQELASSAGADSAGALLRGEFLKGLLDGRLSRLPTGDLVLVEPDSSDGYETLLDKQAYLSDLRDRIVALDKRSGAQIERLTRERALLRASEGFVEESRFLDEGGRVGPGALRLQQSETPPDDGSGHPRTGESAIGTGREGESLTAAPSESTAIGTNIGALVVARSRLAMDLARVDALLGETSALLDRFVPASR